MNAAEVRSVVADLTLEDATVDLIGRVRLDGGAGPVVAEVPGVHRHGLVIAAPFRGPLDGVYVILGEARWYETVMEWHARMPEPRSA